MSVYLIYENGTFIENKKADNTGDIIEYLNGKYSANGLNWKTDLSIRIFEIVESKKQSIDLIDIYRILNTGKRVDINAPRTKQWGISLFYENKEVVANMYDITDITIYVLWEAIKNKLEIDLNSEIAKIKFKVSLLKGEMSQKNKLVLFFSNQGNYGRIWKYQELRDAMAKANLSMTGRGIEGERPRELRYAMGYDFRTSEKDKNVPDGSCILGSPFPFGPRNERRNATVHLNKEDWSELLTILKEDPKRLRCMICGLFEGEANKIGQITKFQKGHYQGHLNKGNVSSSNIFSICQYCNTEESNIYDIDPKTGKKKWNFVAAISKSDYKNKLEIFEFLKNHLKSKDVNETEY